MFFFLHKIFFYQSSFIPIDAPQSGTRRSILSQYIVFKPRVESGEIRII